MQRKTIGIIGGGQLGRMIIQAGINYPIDFHVYSNSKNFSSKNICKEYTIGDLNNYDKIVNFGKKCDIITIEIENVNTDALKYLQNYFKKNVYPQPEILEIIKDRKVQKDFLLENNINTMRFFYYDNISIVSKDMIPPFVNKLCIGGYDGYGTQIIHEENYFDKLYPKNSIIEQYCQMDRELSVIVARNINGDIIIYPPVEMKFTDQNMLDYLVCPVEDVNLDKINKIATKLAEITNLVGILAIELFESNGEIFVNELAPRPHNSGHHTQDMFNNSQFDILIRCLLGLKLYPVKQLAEYGACINILGNPEIETGNAIYNLDNFENVQVHIYDKIETRPYRKMGHLNILSYDRDYLIERVEEIKQIVKNCVDINDNSTLMVNYPKVGVIMGSKSDLEIMNQAINILKMFKVDYEVKIVSAHRTPQMMIEYGETAQERGLEVIIAGAGGAAHLPGMIASTTSLPVIGVPIKSSNSIDGWDSILSILQMPNGVPVATVNLDGAMNAGLLAVRILGNRVEMDRYRDELKEKVRQMNDEIDN